jgi:hypothetical protein
MVDGVVFEVSEELEENHQRSVSRAAKLIGPAAGNEKEISRNLWKLAVAHVRDLDSEPKARVAEFIAELSESKDRELIYVAPNLAVQLIGGLTKFEVGPISMLGSSAAVDRINQANSSAAWSAVAGEPGIELRADGKSDVRVPENAWWVTLAAAADHLEEEALWYIDVLISLLRLTASEHLGPFVGGPGTVEPHPTRPRPASGALTLSAAGGVSAGGPSVSRSYQISPATERYLNDAGFMPVAATIFGAKKDSVGERVFRSLGWLSRGRQASDRSERFLLFFTGLEALLSADDKSAPIIQTIARHAATLMTEDQSARIRNATIVKKLYENRSALVHAGARKTSQRDANTVEHILMSCLWRVLDGVELTSKYGIFQEELGRCSFGLPFNDGRLGWLAAAQNAESPSKPASNASDGDG